MKTYSAASGYVYEFFFDRFEDKTAQFVYWFQVSGDRQHWGATEVCLPKSVITEWEEGEGRPLSASERFGIARILLERGFDERAPGDMRNPMRLDATALGEIAAHLGLL